ncbi:MAG: signal recognition particle-docking protein FtsY, partial [Anaerolineales bacterium]|nr:signal recognition particle-docking protein FtsY [Anaerolineales bacterium]
ESGEDVREGLRRELSDRIRVDRGETTHGSPHVILIVGVNGSGKTTTVARLARRWHQRDADVMLAAGDTVRAAAAEQLAAWAQRLDAPLIQGEPGSDPGAVIYNASETAVSRGADVLIADTSGRMHTSHNLMAELQKVHRVAGKVIPGAPHEVLLVLDATTGQNGISQARSFVEAVPVSGVVLAKLDSSAKGGVVISISQELGLPLRYVGLGENLEDLAPFDEQAFLDGMLAEFDGAPAADDAA